MLLALEGSDEAIALRLNTASEVIVMANGADAYEEDMGSYRCVAVQSYGPASWTVIEEQMDRTGCQDTTQDFEVRYSVHDERAGRTRLARCARVKTSLEYDTPAQRCYKAQANKMHHFEEEIYDLSCSQATGEADPARRTPPQIPTKTTHEPADSFLEDLQDAWSDAQQANRCHVRTAVNAYVHDTRCQGYCLIHTALRGCGHCWKTRVYDVDRPDVHLSSRCVARKGSARSVCLLKMKGGGCWSSNVRAAAGSDTFPMTILNLMTGLDTVTTELHGREGSEDRPPLLSVRNAADDNPSHSLAMNLADCTLQRVLKRKCNWESLKNDGYRRRSAYLQLMRSVHFCGELPQLRLIGDLHRRLKTLPSHGRDRIVRPYPSKSQKVLSRYYSLLKIRHYAVRGLRRTA